MIRRCLLVLPLLWPVVAHAQTPSFIPDLSKPDATAFVVPYAQSGGVAAPVRVEKEGNGLKMTSLAGGSFGVKLNVPPFDLDQLTRLSFDYTATPDARVNMFFRVNGKYYAVLFTGPKKVRAGTAIVYDAHATGAAGHVEIPLRAAIRSLVPNEASLRLDEILVGNWDNEGYMMAGIGGNGPGAAWTLSNFKLEKTDVKPTFGAARFEGDELVVPAQNLDNVPFKSFPLKTSLGEMPLSTIPCAKPSSTMPASLFAGPPLRRPKRSAMGKPSNLHFATARALFSTKAKPRFVRGSAGSFASSPRTHGPRRQISAYRLRGRHCAIQHEPHAQHGFVARLRKPLQRPLERGANQPAHRLALRFARRREHDRCRNHPVFTFAYRCDDRLRLDMNLSWNNQPYSIHFTDSDNPNPRLGDLGVVRDYQWHVAQFNVFGSAEKGSAERHRI